MTGKLKYGIVVIGVMLLTYFAFFHQLERQPIDEWDESLFAVRALWLHDTGTVMPNFNAYVGLPDHRSTKMPFTTFFQAIGYKIFGINALGLRIPNLLIILGSILLIGRHFKRTQGLNGGTIIMLLVLMASPGLFDHHMLRSGDQDVVFGCYLALAIVGLTEYLQTKRWQPLLAFSLSFGAALLTKNLLAGIIAPGILLYIILTKRTKTVLKDWRVYAAVMLSLGLYGAVVYLHERQYPGFVQRMWDYELLGRYSNVIEKHAGPWDYYLSAMMTTGQPFLFVAALAAFALSYTSFLPKSRFTGLQMSFFAMASYLIIVSMSETKTVWYGAPLYIFSAYIITSAVLALCKHIDTTSRNMIPIAITALGVFGVLYSTSLKKAYETEDFPKSSMYGLYFDRLEKRAALPKDAVIVDSNFGVAPFFYYQQYKRNGKGELWSFTRNPGEVTTSGTTVISCLDNVHNSLRDKHSIEVKNPWKSCRTIIIGD